MDKNLKTALIIGGVIIGILVIVPLIWGAVTGYQGYGYGGMMGSSMFGLGWMWLMPILGIIFWGLVIWGIVTLIRGISSSGGSTRETESALEVLRKRYARGEINKEEFEQKKKDLM